MSERTVVIQIDAEEIGELRRRTVNDWGNCGFDHALAYLSTWNLTFPKVRIQKDFGANDLIAMFEREDGSIGYVIGAIWDAEDRKYSFHS